MRVGAGRIDEARKLVQVTAILDLTTFRAAWRGQHYECRALPDTGSLAVGDEVICHVLPDNTQLIAILRPGMLPYGLIIIWSGTRLNIPANWRYCDGGEGTPDLRWTFPVCVGPSFPLHDVAGGNGYDINPDHSHTLTDGDGPISVVTHNHTTPATDAQTATISAYNTPGNFSATPMRDGFPTHWHSVGADLAQSEDHTHLWQDYAQVANALPNQDHRPKYRAYPYIMHMGAADDVPIGGIINWSGLLANIPTGYQLCDGSSGTPDMTDRFVVCEDDWGAYSNGETGGADTTALGHTHGVNATFEKIYPMNHNHSIVGTTASSSDGSGPPSGGGPPLFTPIGQASVAHDHGISLTSSTANHNHSITGSPNNALGTVTNRPIYYTLAFIQRIA